MAAGYKPRQRIVPAHVLTTAGWMTAEFNVLEKGYLLEQLDSVDEFFSVTNASMVGFDTATEFLALQRDAIEIIVPSEEPELLAAPMSDTKRDTVFVLFGGGVIRGDIEYRQNIRLSDFVKKQDGFILLRNCELQLGHLYAEHKEVKPAEAIIVNVNHIVGISVSEPI